MFALVVALIAAVESKPRRAWIAYLFLSLLGAPLYWPEISGWHERFWWWLIAVLALRVAASLEALHGQTRWLPIWPRLMGGIFLGCIGVIVAIIRFTGHAPHEVVNEFRRYLQVWDGLVTLGVWGSLVVLNCWFNNEPARHSVIVGLIVLNHAVISFIYLAGPRGDAFWETANQVSMGFNSLVLFASAVLCRPSDGHSHP